VGIVEVQELKQMIKSNNVPNFLIFTGDEWKVQKIYIEQIAKIKKLAVMYIDGITEIWKTLSVKSLFSQDYLYIVRDDKEFMTEEKLQQKVIDSLNNNMLILTLTSADKRLKILKTYKDSIVEFNALNEAVLKKYIQKEIDLSDRNCEILMEICGYNYGHCLLEIDKIRCFQSYDEGKELQADTVFKYLLEDGTIHVPPKDVIWDFIGAILSNKPMKAYELYQDLKELEVPTLAILSNLYNNTKQTLQVQICQSDDIAKTTGLTAWQIKNAQKYINKFRSNDLSHLMRLIQQIEYNIKTGYIDESIAIDYMFTMFF